MLFHHFFLAVKVLKSCFFLFSQWPVYSNVGQYPGILTHSFDCTFEATFMYTNTQLDCTFETILTHSFDRTLKLGKPVLQSHWHFFGCTVTYTWRFVCAFESLYCGQTYILSVTYFNSWASPDTTPKTHNCKIFH